MTVKIIGAFLVTLACGGMGYAKALAYRREERALQQLHFALEFMENALSFRLPALQDLCREAAEHIQGPVSRVLGYLAGALDRQVCSDVEGCMQEAVEAVAELPPKAKDALRLLGTSLGKFHLDGQLSGMRSVKELCGRQLEALQINREQKLRSYQTLGICAGAALAILLI